MSNTPDRMVYLPGSKVSFHCDAPAGPLGRERCGCNVFRDTEPRNGRRRLKCNGCGAVYFTEAAK